MSGRGGSAPRDPLDLAREHLGDLADAYVVGGRVRDELLGRRAPDTDLAVPRGAREAARRLAARTGGVAVVLDDERDVARVVWPAASGGAVLDVAAFEGDDVLADLRRRDFTVNALAVPISASWPPARGGVLDPTGGVADLASRRLRLASPGALDADPLRMLRAVRLAAELGFEIEAETRAAIRSRSEAASRPAAERTASELLRALATDRAVGALDDMTDLQLLAAVLPEVAHTRGVAQSPPHDRDVYEHTRDVLGALVVIGRLVGDVDLASDIDQASNVDLAGDVDLASDADPAIDVSAAAGAGAALAPALRDLLRGRRAPIAAHLRHDQPGGLPRRSYLRLAGLLHDTAKPATARTDATGRIRFIGHENVGAVMARHVATRLRLSARETVRLADVVRAHLRPLHLSRTGATRRAVYRYYDDLGEAGVDVVLLSMADTSRRTSGDPAAADALAAAAGALLAAWFERRREEVDPVPLVSGNDLVAELGVAPGPEIGRLVAALREARAAGEIATREEAMALARRLLADGPANGARHRGGGSGRGRRGRGAV